MFVRITLLLLALLVALGVGSPDALPPLLQFRINSCFLRFDLCPPFLIVHPLCIESVLMGIELAVLVISIGLSLLPEAIVKN